MYWTVFTIWPIVNLILSSIFKKDKDLYNDRSNFEKVVRNATSAFHSVLCTLNFIIAFYLENTNIRLYSIFFSCSYFIYDSYFILLKNYKSDQVFIIHHLVTLHVLEYLFNGLNYDILTRLVICGELSNFPHYLVYHKMKIGNKEEHGFNSIKFWRHLQMAWFVLFRVILYGQYFTSIYTLFNDYIVILGCYLLYFMGIYWGYGQLKGIYKDYYNKEKITRVENTIVQKEVKSE